MKNLIILSDSEIIKYLNHNGFEERCGSFAYNRPNILIDFTNGYWWGTTDKCTPIKPVSKPKPKSKDLINWGELNRRLGCDRMTVRPNRIPLKHQEKIDALMKAIDEAVKDW